MAYHPVDKHVGARLRLMRDDAGLTQKGIAASLAISFQQVQKYETGANRISMSRLWDFCGILNKQPHDFFEGIKGNRVANTPTIMDGRSARQKHAMIKAFTEIGDVDGRRALLAIARTMANGAEKPPKVRRQRRLPVQLGRRVR